MSVRKKVSEFFKENTNFYHYFLSFILHLSICTAYYNLLTFSFQKRKPEAICIRLNSTDPALPCTESTFCDTANYQRNILYNSSLQNWVLKYNLYCENEIYIDSLNSLIFIGSFLSNIVMAEIMDRKGRLFTFRLEVALLLSGNLIIFLTDRVEFLFIGIFLCFFGNHITLTATTYFREIFNEKFCSYNYYILSMSISLTGISSCCYIFYFNDVYTPFLVIIITNFIILFFSFKVMMESPTWLESKADPKKGDKDPYHLSLINNFKYMQEFTDEVNTYSKEEEMKYCIDEMAFIAEENNKTIKDEEKEVKKDNQNNKNVGVSYSKNFYIAIYLWLFNQVTYYSVVINLDGLQNLFPYVIEIFFISNLVSDYISQRIFDEYGGKITLQYFALTSGFFSFLLYYNFESENALIGTSTFLFFIFTLILSGSFVYIYVGKLFEGPNKHNLNKDSKLPARLICFFIPFIISANRHFFLIISIVTFIVPVIIFYSSETRN
jgi:hypothetical protein